MDNNPQVVKPINDDQELAKVLAGVGAMTGPTDQPMQSDAPVTDTPAAEPTTPAADPVATAAPEPAQLVGYNPPLPTPSVAPASDPSTDLSVIKSEALSDLRPLVDKLDLPSDEKFDTYLLLIRSTDDKALIAPAYAAAQAISDDTRRAQALLDVIKEIDYLSTPAQ